MVEADSIVAEGNPPKVMRRTVFPAATQKQMRGTVADALEMIALPSTMRLFARPI